MHPRFALLLFSLSVVACAAPAANVRSVWLPAYLFGAIGGGDLDLRDVCPAAAVDQLSVGSSWSTLGVSFVTLGVYTPREAKVRCAPKR